MKCFKTGKKLFFLICNLYFPKKLSDLNYAIITVLNREEDLDLWPSFQINDPNQLHSGIKLAKKPDPFDGSLGRST